MDTIQIEKRRIRRIVAERKEGYSWEQFASMSRIIVERLLLLPECRKAETVFAYMPLPGRREKDRGSEGSEREPGNAFLSD